VLISTGQDNPLGLFSYLALLDAGLIAVALHRRWHYLVPLGALGTIALQVGWAFTFLNDAKTTTAMVVCLAFDLLFLAAFATARRLKQTSLLLSLPVAALVLVSFLFAWHFADTAAGLRPLPLFAFIFLADLCVLVLSLLDRPLAKLNLASGVFVFALLAYWTNERLNADLLPWALAFYFVFAVLHSAFPLVLRKLDPEAAPLGWSQIFPPLALALMLLPVLNSPTVSFVLWPAVLAIDLLAIAIAWLSASLVAVGAVLVLTLVAAAAWIFKIPAVISEVPSLLLVVGGFAVLFFATGIGFARKFAGRAATNAFGTGFPGDPRAQLPAMSALLPFVLLVMVVTRLPVADPSSIFGLGLLLVVLALGLAKLLGDEWLPACALAGVLALTYAWQAQRWSPYGALPLAWYLLFYVVFTVFPFVFRHRFSNTRGPWIAAALAGPLFFPLVFRVVKAAWPNDVMGLLPVAFALPALAGLIAAARFDPPENPRRLERLALFGGAALLFVTLVFPIQFERQWITIGWALEGAALLWLFHRVPHRGLPIAGAALLLVAFGRSFLPHTTFLYPLHAYAAIPSGYAYTCSVVVACLFAGAHFLAPPRERVLGLPMRTIANGLGIALLFLLLNIAIADHFTVSPAGYRYDAAGSLARDMTYTIAWALFAFGLLVAGIWTRSAGARYTSLGLLGVVLLKLFFHDLSQLGQLYRIGALFAVAIVAILASFLYQRFLPPADDKKPTDAP
jgi:uncharacterized membrane protein